MKKIFLAAFITLCGVSFSFGNGRIVCENDCLEKFEDPRELQKCLTNECGDLRLSKEPVEIKPEPIRSAPGLYLKAEPE